MKITPLPSTQELIILAENEDEEAFEGEIEQIMHGTKIRNACKLDDKCLAIKKKTDDYLREQIEYFWQTEEHG